MSDDDGFFVITRVSRDDVAEVVGAERAKALSDDDMRRLARRMEDDYIEQLYWGQIRAFMEAEGE